MSCLRSPVRHALASITLMAIACSYAQAGDAVAGRTVFASQCAGCHAVKSGQQTMGPSLSGIVGRKAGTAPGYKNYTAAMKSSGLTWDEATLESFLAAPAKKVPSTSMPMGVASAKDRADVIAYLATLAAEKGASASSATPGVASAAQEAIVATGPASPGVTAIRP